MFDIEKYLRGAEELDRQRKAIPRVLLAIKKVLDKYYRTKENKHGSLLKLVIEEGKPWILEVELYTTEAHIAISGPGVYSCTVSSFNDLPIPATLVVYRNLGKIIEEIDKAEPTAGVLQVFNEIAAIADLA